MYKQMLNAMCTIYVRTKYGYCKNMSFHKRDTQPVQLICIASYPIEKSQIKKINKFHMEYTFLHYKFCPLISLDKIKSILFLNVLYECFKHCKPYYT